MKIQRILCWVTTAIFCLWMMLNVYFYLTSEVAKNMCIHFGFPDYFRIELAIAKIIGVFFLLIPAIRVSVKEWAYSGFVITVVSGFIAHLCSGDSFLSSSLALPALAILMTSYFSYHKLKHT